MHRGSPAGVLRPAAVPAPTPAGRHGRGAALRPKSHLSTSSLRRWMNVHARWKQQRSFFAPSAAPSPAVAQAGAAARASAAASAAAAAAARAAATDAQLPRTWSTVTSLTSSSTALARRARPPPAAPAHMLLRQLSRPRLSRTSWPHQRRLLRRCLPHRPRLQERLFLHVQHRLQPPWPRWTRLPRAALLSLWLSVAHTEIPRLVWMRLCEPWKVMLSTLGGRKHLLVKRPPRFRTASSMRLAMEGRFMFHLRCPR